jgi:hypothetical protein
MCLRGRYDLARGVAGESPLVMEPPLVWEPRLIIEALAILEGLGKRAAGLCSLLSQEAEDGFAGFLAPL